MKEYDRGRWYDRAMEIIENDAVAHPCLGYTTYSVRIGTASRSLIANDTLELRRMVEKELRRLSRKTK